MRALAIAPLFPPGPPKLPASATWIKGLGIKGLGIKGLGIRVYGLGL